MNYPHITPEYPVCQPPLAGPTGSGSAGDGRGQAACLKLHISTVLRKGSQIGSLGCLGSNSGTATHLQYWRTSARLHRAITTPMIDRGCRGIWPRLADLATQNPSPLWKPFTDRGVIGVVRRDLPTDPVEMMRLSRGVYRGKVDSFSWKSRSRLKFVAGNSMPLLISQFCLTYGKSYVPKDGRTAKGHLNAFLTSLRRKYPEVKYLWVLEFQEKRIDAKAAHFHLFLSMPPSRAKRLWMAQKWVDIVTKKDDSKDAKKMFLVHQNPRNFINWDMGKGSYLTKYLDKSRQKEVPEDFKNVGRFWGSSRGLVPEAEIFSLENPLPSIVFVDKTTGETYIHNPQQRIIRILRKHHEITIKRACNKKIKSRIAKNYLAKVNIPSGGLIIQQYLSWYQKNQDPGILNFSEIA